jgi:hypothetical protein
MLMVSVYDSVLRLWNSEAIPEEGRYLPRSGLLSPTYYFPQVTSHKPTSGTL